MKTMKDFIKKHPVLTYFALTFIISWVAVFIVAGGIPVPADQLAILGIAILLGPSIASLTLIGLTSGKEGFRELLSRLLRWKVGARWYAVALLAAPLSIAAVLLALSLLSPKFIPAILTSDNKATLLLSGIAAGLMVGFFEELGWTGFAIPRLRLRYGVVMTGGIVVGLLWGAWHFILFFEGDSFSGAFPLVLLLARLFSCLPAYRILMVWVYDHTESLLVAILMHASLVASLVYIEPPLAGADLLTYILVRAAVWIVMAAVVVTNASGIRINKTISNNSTSIL
jgi:membrane protease YdiL (CAAX protease family)